MDSIRRNQINEVLDYDRNMNAMVFNIEKKNVGLYTENVMPYSQITAEVFDVVKSNINQLIVILEKKKSEIHTYTHINYADDQQPGGAGAKRLLGENAGMIEDVMRLYNSAVEPYITFKITETTKSQILQELRKRIMPILTYLVNEYRKSLNSLQRLAANSRSGARSNVSKNDRVTREYPKLLQSFICYIMILEQLKSGNLHPISRTECVNEIKFYIDNVDDPNVKAVLNEARVRIDREFLTESGDPYFGATSQAQQIRDQMVQPAPVSTGSPPPAAATLATADPPVVAPGGEPPAPEPAPGGAPEPAPGGEAGGEPGGEAEAPVPTVSFPHQITANFIRTGRNIIDLAFNNEDTEAEDDMANIIREHGASLSSHIDNTGVQPMTIPGYSQPNYNLFLGMLFYLTYRYPIEEQLLRYIFELATNHGLWVKYTRYIYMSIIQKLKHGMN